MFRKIKLKGMLLALMLLASCSILDVETISDITNDDFWNAPADVESYLVGIYTKYRDEVNSTYYLEDRGDTFVAGLESGLSSAWNQNLTPQNAPNWLGFYNLIHHCNLLLTNAEPMIFSVEADKNRALAETRFIRAHTYFILLRSWGEVPIETEPTLSDNKAMLPRAPREEVLNFLLQDINAAIELFPEPGYRNKSRASLPACLALKADVLLWKAKVLGGNEQDLEEALQCANRAAEGLSLADPFWHIYATDRKNGDEVIFSLYFQREEKSGHYSSNLKPRDIFVQDAVNRDDIAYARSGARSGYAPSPKIQEAFEEFPDDKRKNESYIKAINEEGNVIGVFDNKMRGSTMGGDRFYDADIIVYRLAEMLLFKAEALAALGRAEEAIAELNKVRERAGIGDYSGSRDKISVERAILQERFKELYLELKRWPDLLRFHYGGVINVYDEVPNLQGKTVPLYFPIPQAQIDLNPNLKQTEGY
ncbi:RagB/SusD family nutrient uptake outer membrane protein [Olivibacter sp. SDN3]|uniref:RagB/SusD family nutrient uptake outer membrane protein n=1 Tax=Olivibacter sp. SDN3 TaxID=2764720 RepID=UPI0016518C7C|nr:RagB/SusD family nutrient uptake outer membrane protein [Olivibacter sp. SDN3]QNL51686.1 RagB/SusD family nutrient uptake outer membrane protein [Olivibacter sp. SDN3]